MKVEATIHFGKKGKKKQAQKSKPQVVGRTPRIAKLMALAIRFEGLIADGTVSDYSELAELAQVSRARITQIMNLLLLAPDIQEKLLLMEPVKAGRDSLTLAALQKLTLEVSWRRQNQLGASQFFCCSWVLYELRRLISRIPMKALFVAAIPVQSGLGCSSALALNRTVRF